jgi:hypothetical protein
MWRQITDDFKNDCSLYAIEYRKKYEDHDKRNLTGYNIFLKAICKSSVPIEATQAVSEILGNTLSVWIQRGYLPVLKSKIAFNSMLLTEK